MRQPLSIPYRYYRHHRRTRNGNLPGDAVGPGSNLLLLLANFELQAVDDVVEGIAVDVLRYLGAHPLTSFL
jgi:hypothetical protein